MQDNIHKSFHSVFRNLSPVLQMARLLELNGTALTRDFSKEVMTILDEAIAHPNFAYKNGILVPNKIK